MVLFGDQHKYDMLEYAQPVLGGKFDVSTMQFVNYRYRRGNGSFLKSSFLSEVAPTKDNKALCVVDDDSQVL